MKLTTLQLYKKISFFFTAFLITTLGFAQQPVISSFSPASGPAGSSVIITGNNFSAVAANNIVFFGAVKANVTTASATSLTVTVPFGATYQPMTVTTNGLTGFSSKPFIQTFAGGLPITSNSFAAKIDSTTDLHPNGLAIADYDGDGKPDIATANNYSTVGSPASVSILRNTGAASVISFAPKFDLVTGVLTYAVAAGDLDGDGKPDLVSCSVADKTISVFKNTSTVGNITFAAKIDYPTGNDPFSIVINDFDADGKPDIAVVNYLSNTLSVFRNTGSIGNISFAASTDFITAFGPRSIAAGDIDGDGKPDIAVSNEFSNNVSAFRNTSSPGNISFAARIDFATGNKPFSVAIGDLNNDGLPELAVSNNSATSFSILRNTSSTGAISFAAKVDFASGASPYLISIGDVNGDGKPDIVLPSFNLCVSENLGTGSAISFSTPWYLNLSPSAFAVAIADLDLDGKADLTGAIFTGTKVSLLRNRNNEPVILFFTPTTATTGTSVTITGTNFTGATGISFGGTPASSFNIVNNTTITAIVANGASGEVSVTNQYGTGKLAGFTYIGPPVINAFTPVNAGTGYTVTITGSYLSGATAVSFGGSAAASFTVVSPDTITAVVANGTSGDVSVTTPYGTASLPGFTFVPKPVITSFTPASGTPGTLITINGSDLITTSAVRFSNFPAASFTVISGNTVTAVVGNGGTGVVHITTAGGMDSLPGFVFIPPPPPITSISPATATAGTIVSIFGDFFTGTTAVSFGGSPAVSFTVISATQINAIVGGSGSGNVVVTTPWGSGSIGGFTLIPTVSISSFSPTSGVIGTPVTINGTNFSAAAANNVVYFGLVKATVINATATQLIVTVPPGAVYMPITVNVNNQVASSSNPFLPTFPGAANITSTSFNNVGTYALGNTGWTFNSKVGCVGDIDRDGKLDVVMGYSYLAAVGIFRNISTNGNILLDNKQDFFPGQGTNNQIQLADMNGDGWLDLVWGDGNTVKVARNISSTGTIDFDTVSNFGYGLNNIKSIEDIDGDARLDMIGIKFDGTIAIFRNTTVNGILSFEPMEVFSTGAGSPWTVILTDIDGDKRPEMISASYSDGKIAVFPNISVKGKIIFATPVYFSLTPGWHAFKSGDIDGDGKPDLVLSYLGGVAVLRNTSTGSGNFSFAPVNNFPITGTWAVELADLNGDSKPDIVADNGLGPNVSLFQNTSTAGNISLSPHVNYIVNSSVSVQSTPLGDLDGDGKTDFVTVNEPTGTFSIFRNQIGEDFADAGPDTSVCLGNSIQIGTAAIPGFVYSWTSSPAGFISNEATPLITPAVTTSYYLVVTNTNGMTAKDTAIVTILPLPFADAGTDQGICNGSSVTIGTPPVAGNTYAWSSSPAGFTSTLANPVVSPVVNTDYVLAVTNVNACIKFDTVVITVNNSFIPAVTITTASTNICTGTSATFIAAPANSGTNPVYQWQVNGINVGSNSISYTTSDINNNDQVKVTLTSSLSCALPATAQSNIITMTVLAPPVANAGNDVSVCAGGSVQLNASGGNIYSWSPATDLNNPNIANPLANPAVTTAYIVTVSNAGNCFAKDTVLVTVNQPTAAAVTISTAANNICSGSAATFTAVPTNGGANPVYQWQVNGITAGTNSNIFTSTSLTNNSQVKVTLTSNSTCITTATATSNIITMNVEQLETPLVSLTDKLFTVTNPDASAIYTWQIQTNAVWADIVPSATGISYTAMAPGAYRVKAVKGACTDYSTSQVANRNVNVLNHPFGIYLYPNPSSGSITIDSIRLAQRWETLDIVNSDGKLVHTVNIKNMTSITIDLSMLRSGIYFAILKQMDGTFHMVEFVRL